MYVNPEEASAILGISRATITRCKNLGAPVKYKGTCGRLYVIDPVAFQDWMDARGQQNHARPAEPAPKKSRTVFELREARHRAV